MKNDEKGEKENKLDVELKKYLSAFEQIEESQDFDVLKYWKERKNIYSRLAKLAKHYLMIPATSISVESLFSTAGQILNERRTRLNREFAGDLIFLEEYLLFQKREEMLYEKETNQSGDKDLI